MTDYNDGKWHGWNGGECPVHPETLVDLRWEDGEPDNAISAAAFDWGHYDGDPNIVAFRVVKEYRAPREYWIVEWGYGWASHKSFSSKEDAVRFAEQSGTATRITHVREVIE